jgi:hypothetical protein
VVPLWRILRRNFQASTPTGTCVAYSKDGIHWEKPLQVRDISDPYHCCYIQTPGCCDWDKLRATRAAFDDNTHTAA